MEWCVYGVGGKWSCTDALRSGVILQDNKDQSSVGWLVFFLGASSGVRFGYILKILFPVKTGI